MEGRENHVVPRIRRTAIARLPDDQRRDDLCRRAGQAVDHTADRIEDDDLVTDPLDTQSGTEPRT